MRANSAGGDKVSAGDNFGILVMMSQHNDTVGNHNHNRNDDAICKDNHDDRYDDVGTDCSRHRGSFGRCGAEHESCQGEHEIVKIKQLSLIPHMLKVLADRGTLFHQQIYTGEGNGLAGVQRHFINSVTSFLNTCLQLDL